ncbi:hypothetical protein HaLaN_05342, partial [Haematococcus lacustris]
MPPKRKRKRPVTPAQGAAGPSGSGQQEDEGQGQGEQEVIAERRQVVKAYYGFSFDEVPSGQGGLAPERAIGVGPGLDKVWQPVIWKAMQGRLEWPLPQELNNIAATGDGGSSQDGGSYARPVNRHARTQLL